MDRSDRALLCLLVPALAAAVYLAVGRARIEAGNRAVEMIVDADEARQVAAAAGVPVLDVLTQFRKAGANALAVRELKLEELVALGKVMPIASPEGTGLVASEPETLLLVGGAIQARVPGARVAVGSGQTPVLFVQGLAMDQLAKLPLSLRMEDLRLARATGLRVVARLMNSPTASPTAIEAAAGEAQAAGARLVVFREDQVLGFQDLLDETAAAFRRHHLLYGYIEMATQKGGDALARLMSSDVVRVHSISDADMLTIPTGLAAPRYQRAVQERDVRACYLRLLLRPQPDPVGHNVRYLQGIVTAVRSRGFRVGPAAPFAGPKGWPPRWARVVVLLGLPSGLLLLLSRLAPVPQTWAWLLLVAVTLAGAAMGRVRPSLVVPLSGLAAACIFPALGVIWTGQKARRAPARVPVQAVVWRAVAALLAASVCTLAGALLIVGIYSRVEYLEGVQPFAGVKVAYLLPLVIILVAVIAELPGQAEPLARWWGRTKLRLAQFLGRRVTVIEAIVILAALGALAFAVSRSGNQAAVAPSAAELKLRYLLESLLSIRPRTKEFLLGHPALMLAVALLLRGRPTWLPLVVVLAGVGQISLLNTFCHFHTPLVIGLIRSAHGLWLGAAIGVLVILGWRVLCDRPPRSTAP